MLVNTLVLPSVGGFGANILMVESFELELKAQFGRKVTFSSMVRVVKLVQFAKAG